MSEFSTRLLAWFDEHGRKDLPWQVSDPYAIWVSEIMLQQTQVQTVIPYYEKFIQRFPDVQALAAAPVDDVLLHWSGLGYYARARNMHKAAGAIVHAHDGVFPADIVEVQALPGIGRSTAGAILALAQDERHPILDGNVKRVLARHDAIAGWPGKTSVADALWAVADRHTPQERAADYTQAIMDLGATLCTRTRPACERCPVHEDCAALATDSIDRYPGRKPKKEKPLKQTTMVLAVSDNLLYLERRPASGIWGGLWSLPECDANGIDAFCEKLAGQSTGEREAWQPLRHSFSHYDLDIRPVVVHMQEKRSAVADDDDAVWYCLDEAPPGGIAAPVQKLINSLKDQDNVSNR